VSWGVCAVAGLQTADSKLKRNTCKPRKGSRCKHPPPRRYQQLPPVRQCYRPTSGQHRRWVGRPFAKLNTERPVFEAVRIAQPVRQGMTYYQGREMPGTKRCANATGVAVSFRAPKKSPCSEVPTKNKTTQCASTYPRGLTCRATARRNWMPLPMKSTISTAAPVRTITLDDIHQAAC
jgi:hypothetical protein